MLFFQFLLLHFYYFCFVYNCYYFIYHKRNRFFFTLCHSYIVLHSTFVHCTTQYIYTFYYTVHLYIVLHSTFVHCTTQYICTLYYTVHLIHWHHSFRARNLRQNMKPGLWMGSGSSVDTNTCVTKFFFLVVSLNSFCFVFWFL